MQRLEEFGVPNRVAAFVLPLGYSFNLVGSMCYCTFAVVFLAQAYDVPLSGGQQMYQALRSLNVPTELIVYPGQFHGFTRPSFIRDRYQRDLDWYDKYLMPKSVAGPAK